MSTSDQALERQEMRQRINSLERELDETLRENTELRRVNDDLENQIHEEGGFIEQIVGHEAAFHTMRELAVRNQAAVLAVEALAYAYILEAKERTQPLLRELIEQIGRDILKRLIVVGEHNA